MVKHAYLIMAHNQFEILEILVKMLDDERNDLYIHIDSKVKKFDFTYFQNVPKYSKITFIERNSVTWGDFSQVKCEFLLLKSAVCNSKHIKYDYYHFLSGIDLPIKTNDEIFEFFNKNYGKEFLHFSANEPQPEFENRIRYYHFFRKKRNVVFKIFAQITLKIQKYFGVNRLKNKNIIVQKGSNWVSITNDFAEYVVSREDFVKETFHHCYCGDEIFMQTLFINSPFKNNLYMPNCNDNQLASARLIDWTRGNPYVFKSSDFNEIVSSPAMFARKFSADDKEIIYKIRDYVKSKQIERG